VRPRGQGNQRIEVQIPQTVRGQTFVLPDCPEEFSRLTPDPFGRRENGVAFSQRFQEGAFSRSRGPTPQLRQHNSRGADQPAARCDPVGVPICAEMIDKDRGVEADEATHRFLRT
jgi:hypothetical protein